MKLTYEVIKWLLDNSYACKDGKYWFLKDFPPDKIPDSFRIPMNERAWIQFKEMLNKPQE